MLTKGGGFALEAYREYPNHVALPDPRSLVELCKTYSYVRAALQPGQLAALEAEVERLGKEHKNDRDGTVPMPYVTRAYMLRKAP